MKKRQETITQRLQTKLSRFIWCSISLFIQKKRKKNKDDLFEFGVYFFEFFQIFSLQNLLVQSWIQFSLHDQIHHSTMLNDGPPPSRRLIIALLLFSVFKTSSLVFWISRICSGVELSCKCFLEELTASSEVCVTYNELWREYPFLHLSTIRHSWEFRRWMMAVAEGKSNLSSKEKRLPAARVQKVVLDSRANSLQLEIALQSVPPFLTYQAHSLENVSCARRMRACLISGEGNSFEQVQSEGAQRLFSHEVRQVRESWTPCASFKTTIAALFRVWGQTRGRKANKNEMMKGINSIQSNNQAKVWITFQQGGKQEDFSDRSLSVRGLVNEESVARPFVLCFCHVTRKGRESECSPVHGRFSPSLAFSVFDLIYFPHLLRRIAECEEKEKIEALEAASAAPRQLRRLRWWARTPVSFGLCYNWTPPSFSPCDLSPSLLSSPPFPVADTSPAQLSILRLSPFHS